MLFTEKQREHGWQYWTKDVFGELTIDSDIQLPSDVLDGVVGVVLNNKSKAEVCTGSVKHSKGELTYKLKKDPIWTEDNQGDISTLIPEQASVLKPVRRFAKKIINWLIRLLHRWLEKL